MKNNEAKFKSSAVSWIRLMKHGRWKRWCSHFSPGFGAPHPAPREECSAGSLPVSAPSGFEVVEMKWMLELARQSIACAVANRSLPNPAEVPDRLREPRACFVTLTRNEALRGCVGHVQARMPLFQAVIENARNAAFRDQRFTPVAESELAGLVIEISVLSEPQRLTYAAPEELLSLLHPNQDGVLLEMGGRQATFLPQVWSRVSSKDDFLGRLAEKAGFPPLAWRGKDCSISIYQVESFSDCR